MLGGHESRKAGSRKAGQGKASVCLGQRSQIKSRQCIPALSPLLQVHLLKLFDNVKSLAFGRGSKQVLGMGSSEGETFQLRKPVAVEGPVEDWMTAVESEMSSSLRSITKEGVFRYANEARQEWITHVLGMVSLVGSQIWWTWEVRCSHGAFVRQRHKC